MVELSRDEFMVMVNKPEVWFAFTKEDVSKEDKAKFHMYLLATMRVREFEWLSRNDGIIDEEMYETYAGAIPIILGTERKRKWWGKMARTLPPDLFRMLTNVFQIML